MTAPRSPRRVLCWIGAIVAVPILILGGGFLLVEIPLSVARPPADMKTLDDFEDWKGGAILGKGTFESAGVTYTVMLAPAGRHLASGPSAYLFDQQGRFVDWTPDMGDCYTTTNQFDLTAGHVLDIKWYDKP
jgi:hypothetical protein